LKFTGRMAANQQLSPIQKFIFYILLGLLFIGCSPVTQPGSVPNSLDPQGAGAREIAGLWWLMAGLGTLVFLAVIGLSIAAVRRTMRPEPEDSVPPVLRDAPNGHMWIWVGAILVPAVILAIVYSFDLRTHATLASSSAETQTVIEVVGHRWWWEVRYQDEEFATANEIHIPIGEPVVIRLRTADVIHSFWVPELHGKMDLVPGQDNQITLQADAAGVYRGVCAEFCGRQHAGMQLLVIAQERDEFNAWMEGQRQPGGQPNDQRLRSGQQVFLGSSCVYCHTVRGTNATADIGPDLTHIASRMTIGAGILPNNPGNLAAWIVDPQHLKPGNLMPPSSMSGEELQLMLEYLLSLE
jgi:cytochrome c oxidase subunit II